MTPKRLLYLDSHRLSAYCWQGGVLTLEGLFEPSTDDQVNFAKYVAAHRASHFLFLANVAEEGYQSETIPFLQGRDRQALISRKLGQYFFGTPLALAIHQGYEKTKRKNERLLLMGLTNPTYIDPWLSILVDVEAPLAGLYSIAQLGPALLRKLDRLPARCILLTAQDRTLRESYIDRGEIAFSRTAPIHDQSIAGLAAAFASEAGKLHQYLLGQRLVSRGDTVPAIVLVHPQAREAVSRACLSGTELHFEIIDNHAAATRLGLHTLPGDSHSEALFLHLLAKSTPRQQFLGDKVRHAYHLDRIKSGLLALGYVALLAGLLFAGREWIADYRLREEAATLVSGENQLEQRYQSIAATFPKLEISQGTLRQVTDRYIALQRNQRLPDGLYRSISQALTQAPAIDLDSLEWKQLPAGAESPNSSGTASESNNRYVRESALVRGTVRVAPEASPRQTLAILDGFVEGLRTTPGLQVSVLQQPFDITSGHALKGGDLEGGTAQARTFTLQIQREVEP